MFVEKYCVIQNTIDVEHQAALVAELLRVLVSVGLKS